MYDIKVPSQKLSLPPAVADNTVFCLSYSADDEYLAAVLDSGEVGLFKISLGSKVHSFRVSGKANIARFHPINSTILAIGSKTGTLVVYNINHKATPLCTASKINTGLISDLIFSKVNPEFVFTAGFDKKIKLYDIQEKKVKSMFTCEGAVRSLSLASNGVTILATTLNSYLQAIDIRNMTCAGKKQFKQEQLSGITALPHMESFNFTNGISMNGMETLNTSDISNTGSNADDSLLGKIKISHRSSDAHELGVTSTDNGNDSLLGKVAIRRRASDTHEVAVPQLQSNLLKRISFSNESRSIKSLPSSKNNSSDTTDFIHVTPKRRKSLKHRIDMIPEEASMKGENKENLISPFFSAQALEAKSSTPQISTEIKETSNQKSSTITPVRPTVDLSVVVNEIKGLRTEMATLNSKVDKLSEQLEQVKIDVQYKIDEAQFNVFTNNHNIYSLNLDHIEDIKGALSIVLRSLQQKP